MLRTECTLNTWTETSEKRSGAVELKYEHNRDIYTITGHKVKRCTHKRERMLRLLFLVI